MRDQFPALIAVLPLTAALISPFLTYFHKKAGRYTVIAALLAANLCAIGALMDALANGPIHYHFGNWAPPLGIEFVIDPLSGVMAVLITFVSLMVAMFSGPFFKEEGWLKVGGYYALYSLLTTGLIGMSITGDIFNLYVFLEISSLSGYGLIALGGKKAALAAFRYLLIGTIGASFYLLGVGYLYAMTGTLNMADMVERIIPVLDQPGVILVVGLFITGFGIKMALFPLHGWQPDAYTYAHPAAAPLIAGVMGKVPAYAALRFFFYIFGAGTVAVGKGLEVMGFLACVGIIIGSVMAIAQKDLRRMLAYSSVAQIGYVIVGLAIGNAFGLIGAILHIVNHAFMKSTLFLVTGAIQWRTGETDINKFGQLYKKMPLTMLAFVIAAISMIGLPPTAGFFSKWYLVLGAAEAGQWLFIVIIIISSLMNAVYFFRILENIFIREESKLADVNKPKGKLELPLTMLLPILVLGLGILVLGFANADIVSNILHFALPEVLLR